MPNEIPKSEHELLKMVHNNEHIREMGRDLARVGAEAADSAALKAIHYLQELCKNLFGALSNYQSRPMETVPKNGQTILVQFKQHGWLTVKWTDHEGDHTSEYAHWHVDDFKHGPFPVRGYSDGDELGWMPLPGLLLGGQHDLEVAKNENDLLLLPAENAKLRETLGNAIFMIDDLVKIAEEGNIAALSVGFYGRLRTLKEAHEPDVITQWIDEQRAKAKKAERDDILTILHKAHDGVQEEGGKFYNPDLEPGLWEAIQLIEKKGLPS